MRTSLKLSGIIFLFLIFSGFAQSQIISPIDITIDRNGVHLNGKLFLSRDSSDFRLTVILLHGFPGSESDVLGVGDKLAQSGMNALTFNYSGTYKSEGKNSWDNIQLDIKAAFSFLHQPQNIVQFKIDTNKIYLGGWCTGGGMALTYSAYHPEITHVFAIAPSDQTEFMKVYLGSPEIKKMMDKAFADMSAPNGLVRFDNGSTLQEIAERGIDKINPIYDLKKCAHSLASREILLIGGLDDKQTTMEIFILPLYRVLQNEGAKNVRFLTFQDDHYFHKTRLELAEAVINWVKFTSNEE
jgi:dipeptidyl aminopeptidase/acylaminoacyl peptidase